MASINYMMATIASCDASYVQQAIEHVAGFAAELRDKAGAATTRLGVLGTGEQAGSLVFSKPMRNSTVSTELSKCMRSLPIISP